MIVKDEEKFLEQCLLSVQGLVDEIVIVDTGSTDKTKEIALRFTSKVYDFVWDDDFAAARNESLKYATGEWILILDADEVIAQQDHTIIKGLLMRAETERDIYGYILIQRNYFRSKEDSQYGSFSGITVSAASQDGEGFISAENDNYEESKGMEGWLATPIVRLCKNTGSTAFSGVVHEDVSPSLPGRIIKTGIVLHHFGKIDSQNWQRKWELYEKLGKKKAFNGENDYYAYFELGRQYLENRKIDLIKIDTQGWEPEVMLGAKKTIEKFRPTIFFEYWPWAYKMAGLNKTKMMAFLRKIYGQINFIEEYIQVYFPIKTGKLDQQFADNNEKLYGNLWVKGEIDWKYWRGSVKDFWLKKMMKRILGKPQT